MTEELALFRSLLSYDPETGLFRWLVTRSRNAKAGAVAGTRDRDGYIWINVGGKKRSAHRMAWLVSTGGWPTHEIDHINGVPGDNRIANLRDVPRKVNLQNVRRARCNSHTGVLGVTRTREGRFGARIHDNGRLQALGTFDTPEEAHDVYLAAKRERHVGCTL